jgi:hypothetical protein
MEVSKMGDIQAKVKNWFHDPSEKFIMALGQGYLTSILQGKISKGCFVLTDKRVYFKGKAFYKVRDGWRSHKTETVTKVKDITSVSFREENYPELLIFGLITMFFIIGIIFLIAYAVKRMRLFVVQHAGGEIMTDSRWYSHEEMREFQRQISLIKDQLNE